MGKTRLSISRLYGSNGFDERALVEVVLDLLSDGALPDESDEAARPRDDGGKKRGDGYDPYGGESPT